MLLLQWRLRTTGQRAATREERVVVDAVVFHDGRAQDEKERKWTPALALAPKFFSEKTAVLAEYGCKRTVTAFSVQH